MSSHMNIVSADCVHCSKKAAARCETLGACSSLPCQHGGTCTNTANHVSHLPRPNHGCTRAAHIYMSLAVPNIRERISLRDCQTGTTAQTGPPGGQNRRALQTQRGFRCSCTTGFSGDLCDKANVPT